MIRRLLLGPERTNVSYCRARETSMSLVVDVARPRPPAPENPGRRRTRRTALLLWLTVGAAAAAAASVALAAALRDLPGDVDALLVRCAPCPRAVAVDPLAHAASSDRDGCFGVSGGGGGGGGSNSGGGGLTGLLGGWRDRWLRRLIRRFLLAMAAPPKRERCESFGGEDCAEEEESSTSCGDDRTGTAEDDEEEERLCRACVKYRLFRAHVRIGQFLLRPNWWHRCEFRARNVTLTSRGGAFVERRSPSGDQPGRAADYYFLPGVRDVLRWDVVEGGEAAARCPPAGEERGLHSPLPTASAAAAAPPPAVEIADARVGWRSWKYPVVDVHMSGVTFHVVFGSNRSGTPLGMPVPVVLLGDTPLDEALDRIPRPPEEEGTYPRIGVVNVTDVSVLFHIAPDRLASEEVEVAVDDFAVTGPSETKAVNCSIADFNTSLEEKKRPGQFAKIDVPNEYFHALLNATLAMSVTGIDQFHFNSIVENALKRAIRQQLLYGADFSNFLDHIQELSDALKKGSMEKLKDGAQFLDSFVSEGHGALDLWWKDLRQDWKRRNERIGEALQIIERNWDNFLQSVHFDAPKLNRYVDNLAKSLNDVKSRTADWKMLFPKIADQWKKGWAEVEQSWFGKALAQLDIFVADMGHELKKMQSVYKEENK